jgi:hypothetical protein
MYRNTGILRSFIKILDWDLQFYEYLSDTTYIDILVRYIYEVMAWSTINNPTTKEYLMKWSKPIFLRHFVQELSPKRGIAASILLNYIIEENIEIYEQ